MATVRAFPALRPAVPAASRVSSVPYDVVSTEEARRLAEGNPLSFLHVSRPEIDLPQGTDPHADEVYEKAAANFETLKRDAPLASESEPSVYVYRLRAGDHEQTGVAACCSIDEYDSDVIRKHERTRRDKEDDRTRHMLALSAQTGPVFLTYRDDARVDALVAATVGEEPLYDLTSEDGIRHTLWRMERERGRQLEKAFETVPTLYIADGHHRAASASRARQELREKHPGGAGKSPSDFFLTVLFPASQVRILAYNRVVRELNGLSPDGLLAAARGAFRVSAGASPAPRRRGEISMYLAGTWYGLTPEGGKGGAGPIESLDVSILQENLLAPILGIQDVRTDPRIDFIGGARGTAELERLVDGGKAAVAFSLYPVSLDELMAISDANEIMPPKSTWFDPKLRDGLLIHRI